MNLISPTHSFVRLSPELGEAHPEGPYTEADLRIELAACFRLAARFGLDDLVYSHISARVPGRDDHILINPDGMFFAEVTATSLVKIDLDGNKVDETPQEVDPAGCAIHTAVHCARSDAGCVVHTHSDAATAVSALEEGLLPLSQSALHFYNRMGVHPYDGVVHDPEEQRRLVKNLGGHRVLLMRNHGLLTVGQSVPEAFMLAYHFERAARVQLSAQSVVAAGQARLHQPPHIVNEKAAGQLTAFTRDTPPPGAREWPGFLRMLDSVDPGYRD